MTWLLLILCNLFRKTTFSLLINFLVPVNKMMFLPNILELYIYIYIYFLWACWIQMWNTTLKWYFWGKVYSKSGYIYRIYILEVFMWPFFEFFLLVFWEICVAFRRILLEYLVFLSLVCLFNVFLFLCLLHHDFLSICMLLSLAASYF